MYIQYWYECTFWGVFVQYFKSLEGVPSTLVLCAMALALGFEYKSDAGSKVHVALALALAVLLIRKFVITKVNYARRYYQMTRCRAPAL